MAVVLKEEILMTEFQGWLLLAILAFVVAVIAEDKKDSVTGFFALVGIVLFFAGLFHFIAS